MRRRLLPRKNPALDPASPEALFRESPTWTHLGKEHPAPRQPASGRCSMRAGPFGRPLQCTETHRNPRRDRSQVNFAAFAAKPQNKTCSGGVKRRDVSDAPLRLVIRDRLRPRPASICGAVDRGVAAWIESFQPAGVQSPIVFPPGSANQANVPLGIVTGGTRIVPPRDSAFARDEATSST